MSKVNDSGSTFPWADATTDWSQPEYYSTIRMADINGDGKAELLVRNGSGILAYSFDDASGLWQQMLIPVLPLPDTEGWNLPQYYSTIRTGDIDGDGKDEVLVRGSGGILSYGFDEAGQVWRQIAPSPIELSDQSGWNSLQYFSTIMLADINGDGRAEVLARGASGLRTIGFSADDNVWEEISQPIPLTDVNKWNRPEYYLTIIAADVDGDGKAEVLARGSAGVDAYHFDSSTLLWQLLSAGPIPWTDDANWNQAQHYSTIVSADINGDGKAEVLGYGPNGVEAYGLDRNTNEWQQLGVIELRASSIWPPSVEIDYYSGIRVADIDGDGRAEVLVRGQSGMHIFRFDDDGRFHEVGTSPGWLGDSSFFDPDATDSRLSAAAFKLSSQLGFNFAQDVNKDPLFAWMTRAQAAYPYASTLRVADVDGDGRAEVIAIQRTSKLLTFESAATATGIDLTPIESIAPSPTRANYAVDLNGSDQWLAAFDSPRFGVADFTVEAWISTSQAGPVFWAGSSIPVALETTEQTLGLSIDAQGAIVFSLEEATNRIDYTSTATSIFDGKWHHVAATRQGPNATIFFDGNSLTSSASGSQSVTIDLSKLSKFNMGANYQSSFFKGQIDEARVWNRALTGDEILDGMNHQLTDSEPGLVSHWTFDNQDASDAGPAANHLMPQNQPAFVLAELDFAPPGESYLIIQAQLMQDYRLDPSAGALSEINGYRTVISAKAANGTPRYAEIMIWATEPTTLHFPDGTSALVDEEALAIRPTSIAGEVSFVIEADDELLHTPMLKVRADFMVDSERLVIAPDRHLHNTLKAVTGRQLLGADENGNPLPDVAKGRRQAPLPDGISTDQAEALAKTISHVMSTAVEPNVQPDRPQIRSRSMPEDVPLTPYTPRYQPARQITEAYDPRSDYMAPHFLPADQLVTRILSAEKMPSEHWMWSLDDGTFTTLQADQVQPHLAGYKLSHLDDLTKLFRGQLKPSVSSSDLLNKSRAMVDASISKRWLGESIFKKVEEAAQVVVTTVEVTVADAVDEAERLVKVIVATIVTKANEAFDAVLQTVEDAANFVAAALKKLGGKIKDLLDYFKTLFEWDDILKTQRVLAEYMKQMPAWAKDVIDKVKDRVDTTLDSWEQTINDDLDKFIQRFGGELNTTASDSRPANAPPTDVVSNYVLSLFSTNIGDIVNPDGFSLKDTTLTQELSDALTTKLQLSSSNNILDQVKAKVLSTNLVDLLSDPAKLLRTGLVDLLKILKELMQIAWQAARAVVDAILNLIKRALDELYNLGTLEIKIPFLTELYELSTEGDKLTFFNLFALATAIPLNVTYKSITGKDEAFFDNADYEFIKKTSWQDYDWLNQFVDAALGNSVPSHDLTSTRSEPSGFQKFLWAGAYLSAVSTSVWGVMSTINDIPGADKSPEPSKLSLWKKSLGKAKIDWFSRAAVASEGSCWVLAAPSILVIQAWEASPGIQCAIWIGTLVPFAVDLAGMSGPGALISGEVNAVIIGVCGSILLVAYAALAISQATSGDDLGKVIPPLLLVNYPSSLGMTAQFLKDAGPEAAELVPWADMVAYTLVVGGTIGLTSLDIDNNT